MMHEVTKRQRLFDALDNSAGKGNWQLAQIAGFRGSRKSLREIFSRVRSKWKKLRGMGASRFGTALAIASQAANYKVSTRELMAASFPPPYAERLSDVAVDVDERTGFPLVELQRIETEVASHNTAAFFATADIAERSIQHLNFLPAWAKGAVEPQREMQTPGYYSRWHDTKGREEIRREFYAERGLRYERSEPQRKKPWRVLEKQQPGKSGIGFFKVGS